jgi:hypothetical protein
MRRPKNGRERDDPPRRSATFAKRQFSRAEKDEIMRHIEVKYQDGTHAFVDDYLLDSLIRSGKIQQFYRPAEKRWIIIGVDPIRKEKREYPGAERRRTGHCREMVPLPSSASLRDSLSVGRI